MFVCKYPRFFIIVQQLTKFLICFGASGTTLVVGAALDELVVPFVSVIEILPPELVVMPSLNVEVTHWIIYLVQPEVNCEGRVKFSDCLIRDFSRLDVLLDLHWMSFAGY
jgi:hypothetical protein